MASKYVNPASGNRMLAYIWGSHVHNGWSPLDHVCVFREVLYPESFDCNIRTIYNRLSDWQAISPFLPLSVSYYIPSEPNVKYNIRPRFLLHAVICPFPNKRYSVFKSMFASISIVEANWFWYFPRPSTIRATSTRFSIRWGIAAWPASRGISNTLTTTMRRVRVYLNILF